MEKVIMKAARTDNGYCCSCDIIPGWVVAYTGDIDGFKGRREKGEDYPKVFDGEYELVYDFDIATLLDYYRGVFSFSALQTITGINQKQLAHYASRVSSPRPKQAKKIKVGLRKLAKDIEMVTF